MTSFFSGNPLLSIARRCIGLFSQATISEAEFLSCLKQVIPLDQARRLLASQDSFLRLGAVCLLRHLPPAISVELLLSTMQHDRSPIIRLAALEALLQRPEAVAKVVARAATDDADPLIRTWAQNALKKAHDNAE